MTSNAPKRAERRRASPLAPSKAAVVDFAEERKIQAAAEQLGAVRDGRAPLSALMSLLVAPFNRDR